METLETLYDKILKDKKYKDKTAEETDLIIEQCQVKHLIKPERNKADIVNNYNDMQANLDVILQLHVKYVDEDGQFLSASEIAKQVDKITESHQKHLDNLEKQLYAIIKYEEKING